MNKIILVCYYKESISYEEIAIIRKEVDRSIKGEDILFYLVPTTDDVRIECINPKLVSEDDYKIVKEKLETINSDLDKLLVKLNAN